MQAVLHYITTLAVFLAVDAIWLGLIAKSFYQQQLGELMAEQVRWGAAVLFYLLYIAGLLVFCVWPHLHKAQGWAALGYGAFFGLVAYATYDLTNLATLRGFPVTVVLVDLAWGAAISGGTAWASWWIGQKWFS